MRRAAIGAASAIPVVALVLALGSGVRRAQASAEPERPSHFECSDAARPVLSGRDVVAYHSLNGEPSVRGTASHAATHDGHVFHFVNSANLARFQHDPKRFVPQFGAFCSWGISTEFAPQWAWAADNLGPPVDPDVYAIVEDRLFLFLNTDVREKFLQNQDAYAAAGDARWTEFFAEEATLWNTMCYRCGDAGLARECA